MPNMKGQNQQGNRPRTTAGISPTPSPTPAGKGNGHRRSNSRYSNSGGSTPTPSNGRTFGSSTETDQKVALAKLTGIITKAIGKKVAATVSSGARYQGLLVNADTTDAVPGLSVALYKPVLVQSSPVNDKSNVDTNLPEKLIIQLSELLDVEILNLNILEPSAPSVPATPTSVASTPDASQSTNYASRQSQTTSKFKTDTDISKSSFRERELQRWVPEEHELQMNPDLILDDDLNSSSNSGWDQFKVNQDKFGVDSTFDEHLYTTRINKLTPDYQDRVNRAARIAREIETLQTSDRHILEERGVTVDDSGMDEEDKYSGVDRRGDELMAALRGPIGNSQNVSVTVDSKPKPQEQPKYNAHEKRAARYHNDPAIVHSSATGSSLKQSPPPDTASVTAAVSGALSTPASTSTSTASTLKNKPASFPPKPPVVQPAEQFRLNAQSEINALKEFSANFKIPHRMPNDLLPILSKDQKKQEEIIKKQHEVPAQSQTTDLKIPKDIKTGAVSPSSSVGTIASSSTSTSTTPHLTRKKLETKSTFNPKAASFTPGNAKLPLQSPVAQKSTYHRASNTNPSPRVSHLRPYSSQGSSGTTGSSSSSKRLHHISAADFFGGQAKVPTKEGQEEKLKLLRNLFCLFATVRRRFAEDKKEGHITYDRTYQTPPTWDSTVDKTHDQIFPNPDSIPKQAPGMMMTESGPFMPNPLLNGPTAMAAALSGGYSSGPGNKPPLNAHQQQYAAASMAAFQQLQQQQQFHAAILYQQQLAAVAAAGGIPPGQPPMPMYPGSDPFLPPGAPGFIAPPGNFMGSGSGSPVHSHMMLGGNMGQSGQGGAPGNGPNVGGGPGYQGGNYGHHGGRRYNNNNNSGGNSGNKRNN